MSAPGKMSEPKQASEQGMMYDQGMRFEPRMMSEPGKMPELNKPFVPTKCSEATISQAQPAPELALEAEFKTNRKCRPYCCVSMGEVDNDCFFRSYWRRGILARPAHR